MTLLQRSRQPPKRPKKSEGGAALGASNIASAFQALSCPLKKPRTEGAATASGSAKAVGPMVTIAANAAEAAARAQPDVVLSHLEVEVDSYGGASEDSDGIVCVGIGEGGVDELLNGPLDDRVAEHLKQGTKKTTPSAKSVAGKPKPKLSIPVVAFNVALAPPPKSVCALDALRGDEMDGGMPSAMARTPLFVPLMLNSPPMKRRSAPSVIGPDDPVLLRTWPHGNDIPKDTTKTTSCTSCNTQGR